MLRLKHTQVLKKVILMAQKINHLHDRTTELSSTNFSPWFVYIFSDYNFQIYLANTLLTTYIVHTIYKCRNKTEVTESGKRRARRLAKGGGAEEQILNEFVY